MYQFPHTTTKAHDVCFMNTFGALEEVPVRECDVTTTNVGKNVWFVSTIPFLAADVYISLPTDWVRYKREGQGVYRGGRDLFMCQFSTNMAWRK